MAVLCVCTCLHGWIKFVVCAYAYLVGASIVYVCACACSASLCVYIIKCVCAYSLNVIVLTYT